MSEIPIEHEINNIKRRLSEIEKEPKYIMFKRMYVIGILLSIIAISLLYINERIMGISINGIPFITIFTILIFTGIFFMMFSIHFIEFGIPERRKLKKELKNKYKLHFQQIKEDI